MKSLCSSFNRGWLVFVFINSVAYVQADLSLVASRIGAVEGVVEKGINCTLDHFLYRLG